MLWDIHEETKTMKAKTYVILERAVEEGFRRGYRRAFKHVDSPSEDSIEESVVSAIMGDVCEVFTFDDDSEVQRCRKCSCTPADDETP